MSLPADTNPMEAVLIGCCPSSGSTLLSLLLDAHPQMICGPELWLFAHPFFWSLKGQAWQERLTRFFRTGAPDYFELPDWNLNHGVCEYADLLVANHLEYYASSLDELFGSISGCGSGRELAARICAPAPAALGQIDLGRKIALQPMGHRSLFGGFPRPSGHCDGARRQGHHLLAAKAGLSPFGCLRSLAFGDRGFRVSGPA